MRKTLALGLLALAACSSSNIEATLATHPQGIGVGEQRVLIALVDPTTSQIEGSPDLEVTATLRDRIGSPLGEYPGEFIWIVPEVRGLYAFNFDIPGPGTFQVTLDAGELGELGPVGITTSEDPPGLGVGEMAVLSETRTTATDDLANISSDPDPDPSFYEMTVAEAVSGGPSVLVFGTPAWCTSQACGPMLNQVKTIAPEFPQLNFVHVEIYENIHVQNFDELIPVPAVEEWQLISEPWVYVTDAEGRISAAFEGAVSDAELRQAFASVSS